MGKNLQEMVSKIFFTGEGRTTLHRHWPAPLARGRGRCPKVVDSSTTQSGAHTATILSEVGLHAPLGLLIQKG